MHWLQRKGMLTVVLLALAETVQLTNAVTFWSKYDKFSERYARGRAGGRFGGDDEDVADSPFARAAQKAQTTRECAASGGKQQQCDAGAPNSAISPRLFRLAKRVASRDAAMPSYNAGCCASCPACLDIRGGHSHHHGAAKKAAEAVVDAAASAASGRSLAPTEP